MDYNLMTSFDIEQFSPCCNCKSKECGLIDGQECQKMKDFSNYVLAVKKLTKEYSRILRFIKSKGLLTESYGFENEEAIEDLKKDINKEIGNLSFSQLTKLKAMLNKPYTEQK